MKRALILSALLFASACGQSDEPAAEPVATPTDAPAPSGLSLEPLQNGDGSLVADKMTNIGGCTFRDKDGRELLMVGIPDTYGQPAGPGVTTYGAARVNGKPTPLSLENATHNIVEQGPTMTGGGFTVTVLRAEGEGKPMDMEQVEYAADLVVSDGAGDSRTYSPGGWRCGV